jgi:hypothetical protein
MIRSFGKLEIPWMWAILLAGGWSTGTAILYPLSYYLRDEDSAGYICYSGSAALFLIIALIYAYKRKESLKSKWPNPKIFIAPFIASSIIMALPWSLTGYFFENFRFDLPGGDWLAIIVFTDLAVLHATLLTFMVKPK